MSQPTPNDLNRSDNANDQATVMQAPADKAALATGIQALPGGPRLEVGPVPMTRVAHYELIKEIGRGGMGVVFKARDVRLNRIVALKMIRGGTLANSDERQRFEKEAAAAAQLQHPNIVALHDISPYDEQPFLSMEFIGGTSLAERVSLGPLSGRRAAEYLELTARAVHYAHSRGIVHRDLKPANVLLDEHDQPKVTDFGLAKQLQTGSDQTRTGAILGTPSYMSPEQAAGSKDITPASDVYSLGAILYELITGKPPFTGESPLATLNLVTEQEPVPPRVLNQTVDRDLETICLKCLEKSPARRYSSAESLADDLRRYINSEPITARRVGALGRALKWCKRNPAWTVVSAVSAASMITFLTLSWFIVYEEKDLREQAQKAEKNAAERLTEMRRFLYLSEMRQAQLTLRRADYEGTMRILQEQAQASKGQARLRDWEWFFLKERCQTRLAFGSHTGPASAVAFRPDGKMLASAGGPFNKPGEIKLWELGSGKLLDTLTGHANAITALAFHPEKPLLASASHDKTIKVWNVDTGKEVVTLRGHAKSVNDLSFNARGDRLASASDDLTACVWDWQAAPAEPVVTLRLDAPVLGVAFHPENPQIATGCQDSTVKIWHAATGQLERNLVGHQGEVQSLAFSADGKVLVSAGGKGNQRGDLVHGGEVLFWDADTGKLRVSHFGLSARILSVSMSRDGKAAAAGADGILRIWNHSASSEALSLRADPQTTNAVAFAPDGHSLATASTSGRISLWNSSAGSETLNLPVPGIMEIVAFHPRDSLIAAAGTRGDVRVWDLDFPQRVISIEGFKRNLYALAFSTEGTVLATAGEERAVRVVDFRDRGKPAVVYEGHTAPVNAVVFVPKGPLIASAGEDEAIHVWNAADAKPVRILKGHETGIRCLAVSPDGATLASGSFDRTIRLWNLTTGESLGVLKGHTGSINSIALSPDGQRLASASSDKTIRVWNLSRSAEEFILEGTPGKVQSIAFHPRGRRLVSIGQDRMIRIWDLSTRQEILEFEEHVGSLRSVAFSADGRSLAGAGAGVVRIWRASREIAD